MPKAESETTPKPIPETNFKKNGHVVPIHNQTAETPAAQIGFKMRKTLESTGLKVVSGKKKQVSKDRFRIETVVTKEEVSARIREAERQINSYKWKLRNDVGKPETANKNIEKFQEQIRQLEAKAKTINKPSES